LAICALNNSNTYLFNLVDPLKMLSSMAVAYGDAYSFEISFAGNQQEVNKNDKGFFNDIVPLSENSIFDIASLTKLFTCVSILKLMENRQLSMTDTIAYLDPRFSNLSNTSLFDVLSYRAHLKSQKRIDEAANFAEAQSLVFGIYESREGRSKLYSDMNALVLKYVIEAVAGSTFDEFLSREIFTPLGMFSTFGFVPYSKISLCVNYNYEHKIINDRYTINTEVPLGTPHDPKAKILRNNNNAVAGHAGIFSSIGDMALFCQGLLKGRIMSQNMLSLIGMAHTGFIKASGQYQQYMGLLCFSKSHVERFSEVPKWMHSNAFALSGYTGCHIAIDPVSGIFEVMLGNRCHNRVSLILPENSFQNANLSKYGSGNVIWDNGRAVNSSVRYVYNKDSLLHKPVFNRLLQMGLIKRGEKLG
jgi:CubicO group peptidase (beta-lactamase class C family)